MLKCQAILHVLRKIVGLIMSDTQLKETQNSNIRYKAMLVCILVALCIWFSPKPEAVPPEGWHLLAIFITTILALILKPLPMGAVALIAMLAAIFTNTLAPAVVFGAFQDTSVWLVVLALFIAKGFAVTGLGKRIAYFFSYLLGRSSLGLGYGLITTDLLIAPATPSVTGRVAGIVLPILKGIANSYQSFPASSSSRRIGGFLTLVAFQGTAVTSSMFLTAMAANPILHQFTQAQGLELSWGKWALAGIVPGLINLALIPLVIYWLYPPEIKYTPDAPMVAKEQLKLLGKVHRQEWIMIFTILLLLVAWIFGAKIQTITGIPLTAVVAGLMGVCILLLTGVLNWQTLIAMDSVWDTFVWFCVLMMLAGNLNTLGVVGWFSQFVGNQFGGLNWQIAFPILALIYFYSHYFFASSTAHVTSLFTPFLALAISLQTPPMLAALVLIFFSNLYGGITHYSLTPAPILYGEGYVDIKDWWRVGFIVSVLNIVVWSTIGVLWWKFLGFW
ncbi:MAG TPA: DASS family sodium-coupled anion symporter [Gammaproteobacteria bacterium]|nr:DASS family sodium-coupled anion symporter [Gammaproteobacteria bacterium]